jgi:hypothetical protein
MSRQSKMSIACYGQLKLHVLGLGRKANEHLNKYCNYFSSQGVGLVDRWRRGDIYIYLSRAVDFAPRLTLRTMVMSRRAINLAALVLSKLPFKNSKPK